MNFKYSDWQITEAAFFLQQSPMDDSDMEVEAVHLKVDDDEDDDKGFSDDFMDIIFKPTDIDEFFPNVFARDDFLSMERWLRSADAATARKLKPYWRTPFQIGSVQISPIIRPSDNVLSSLQGSDRTVILKYIDALTNQIGWDPPDTTTDTTSLPDDKHAVPPDTTSTLQVPPDITIKPSIPTDPTTDPRSGTYVVAPDIEFDSDDIFNPSAVYSDQWASWASTISMKMNMIWDDTLAGGATPSDANWIFYLKTDVHGAPLHVRVHRFKMGTRYGVQRDLALGG